MAPPFTFARSLGTPTSVSTCVKLTVETFGYLFKVNYNLINLTHRQTLSRKGLIQLEIVNIIYRPRKLLQKTLYGTNGTEAHNLRFASTLFPINNSSQWTAQTFDKKEIQIFPIPYSYN